MRGVTVVTTLNEKKKIEKVELLFFWVNYLIFFDTLQRFCSCCLINLFYYAEIPMKYAEICAFSNCTVEKREKMKEMTESLISEIYINEKWSPGQFELACSIAQHK